MNKKIEKKIAKQLEKIITLYVKYRNGKVDKIDTCPKVILKNGKTTREVFIRVRVEEVYRDAAL